MFSDCAAKEIKTLEKQVAALTKENHDLANKLTIAWNKPNDQLRAAKAHALREAAEKLHDYGNPWVSDGLRRMANEIEKGERE